jgi:phage baseplate assembly protein W
MVAPLYRGFSTVNVKGLDTRLFDVDLVNVDLLNKFNTRLGERVGRPLFGSIIHELLFNLGDPRTEGLVIADAKRIVSEDPRLELLEVRPTLNLAAGSITLEIDALLVEFDMNVQFVVTFEERI